MTDFAIQGYNNNNNDELTFDWVHLLDDNIPDFGGFDYPFPPNPDSCRSLSIDDIEQYLFDDDAFLPESSKPDSFEVQQKEDLCVIDDNVVVENVEADDDDDDDDDSDDPVEKKRKRKMRNRDAAMRSRERKKEYVKDLEMKSKYNEAECKRLGILLQNCLAENQVLRYSLHNSKAFDASMAKQESAVLLLELLLLGSLLGPLGIICLLFLPSQFPSTLEKGLRGNVDIEEWGKVVLKKPGSVTFSTSLASSFMMSKRCKASRSRFKDEAGIAKLTCNMCF